MKWAAGTEGCNGRPDEGVGESAAGRRTSGGFTGPGAEREKKNGASHDSDKGIIEESKAIHGKIPRV